MKTTKRKKAGAVEPMVSNFPSSIGRLEQAKRFALSDFDKWNDVTGLVAPHTSYYYELQSCLEDAVEYGWYHSMKIHSVIHNATKNDSAYVCRIDKAKTRLGMKFFCPKCNRYILPDPRHTIRYLTGREIPNLLKDRPFRIRFY